MDNQKIPVCIVGAGGNLGFQITKAALDNPKLEVSILIRDASKYPDIVSRVEKAGGKVIIANPENPDSIKGALKGFHTVVTSVTGGDTFGPQMNLISECINSGVKRFIPSLYGLSDKNVKLGTSKIIDGKKNMVAELEKVGLDYVMFSVGLFFDWYIPVYGLTCWGDTKQKINITCYEDVGKYVAAVLARPEIKGEVKVQGSCLSFEEIGQIYSKALGKDVLEVKGTLEDLQANIKDNFSKGNFVGGLLGELMYVMFGGSGYFEENDNEKFSEVQVQNPLDWPKLHPLKSS